MSSAKGARKIKLIKRIFIVWGIALGWTIIGQWAPVVFGILHIETADASNYPMQLLLMYGEGVGIMLMYLRYRHDPALLGLTKKNVGRDIARGVLAGLVFFALIWSVISLFGGYHVTVAFRWHYLPWLILFLFGYGVQSMFEETVSRGYTMGYWLERGHYVLAFSTNVILFALLHGGNPGFDWYAIAGLLLFGIAMSALRLISHNIWLCSAFHGTWNFAEGCIFGTSVSGLTSSGMVLTSTPTTTQQFLTGGSFGLERSGVSIIAHLLLVLLLFVLLRSHFGKFSVGQKSLLHS